MFQKKQAVESKRTTKTMNAQILAEGYRRLNGIGGKICHMGNYEGIESKFEHFQ